MSDIDDRQEDARLQALFREAMPAVPDDGFSDRVIYHIGRGRRTRRAVLGVAAIVGAAIAIRPAGQLLLAAGDRMSAWFAQTAVLSADRFEPMIVVVLVGLLSPFLVDLIED